MPRRKAKAEKGRLGIRRRSGSNSPGHRHHSAIRTAHETADNENPFSRAARRFENDDRENVMIRETLKNQFWRKSLKAWAAESKEGSVDRREFLALATIFGASTAAAYEMIGLAAPTPAFADTPKNGGVIKCGCLSRTRRTHAPTTGRRWAMSRASSSSRWCVTLENSPSSRCCSRAGTSTPTPPNIRSTCARA